MSFRSLFYWLACSALAFTAAASGKSVAAEPDSFVFSVGDPNTLTILPVPEPGRAVLMFAGMMAMAFTYRRVWLNWKRAS